MEKAKNLSAAKRMLVGAVMDTELNQSPHKETILQEADKLPVHWLYAVAKRTGKASMDALVHSTQKLVVYLLNYLYNDHSESKSGISYLLQKKLISFLRFLEKNGRNHFDFDSPMPRVLWASIRDSLRNAIFPGDGYCLRDTDTALVDLLHGECRHAIGNEPRKIRVPSFRRGYYWSQLMEQFRSTLPLNDATQQTVYTLIRCNFNSPSFVQYVLTSYGKGLEPDSDATDFWLQHQLYLNGIVEKPGMALNPSMDTCRMLLMERIYNEIDAHNYARRTRPLNQSANVATTTMSIPQLALFYRLQLQTGMLQTRNKMSLMKQVAALYQTPSGNGSYKSLYDHFYNVDKPAIEKVMNCLSDMMSLATKLSKNPGLNREF